MGVVYKALDPTIGRTVALKTMRIDVHGLESDDVLRRFKNEARAAGVLNHPNIVTIYDAGEQDGVFYMAMEYMEGTTLHSLLAENRVLQPEQIVQIARQVCKGLDYAHSHQIIHRDIKPANIMLTPNGTVKIMDFGIAKAGGGMTGTGQILGTPNYMSPEQVKGKVLDGRSDLFSFGVLLYEMVTGEKPFVGQNVTTIIYKIVHESPIAPRDLDVTIHPGLSEVVTKALAKSPDDRYQTGAELVRDLENYKAAGTNLGATMVMSSQGEATQAFSATAAAPAMRRVASLERPPTTTTMARSHGWMEVAFLSVLMIAGAVGGFGYYRYRMALKVEQATQARQAADQRLETKLREEQLASAAKETESLKETPAVKEAAPAEKAPAKAESEAPRTAAALLSPNKVFSHQGELRFTSSPAGAKVEVDSWTEPTWITPFRASNLAAGTHTVLFTHAGYIQEKRTVTVSAGKSLMISAQLKPATSTVFVSSTPPGASILVDGRDTEKTTPAEMTMEKGEHTVVVRMRGYKDVSTTETLAEGQSLTFSPVLQQLQVQSLPKQNFWRKVFGNNDAVEAGKGIIQIRTDPEGATILVNNKVTGDRTNARWAVDPGAYDITLKMDGYKTVSKTLNVQKGQTRYVDEILEKQP
jgi:serine/threonine-protein kinase